MILIVDNTERKMRRIIREELFRESVPCAVTNTDKIDIYLPAGAIIVTEKYILPDVKYMADMHKPSPIVLYDEKRDFCDFVYEVYKEYCRDDCEGRNNLRIRFVNDTLTYYLSKIDLSKTEKRIVKLLLFANDWVSGEYLSLYCLKKTKPDARCVAVHVFNINKKMEEVTGISLVEHRRYSGYRIKRR